MDLLTNLGVNSTLWIHLAIFLFTLVVVKQLVFKPYLAAYNKRMEQTEGNEQTAQKLNSELVDLSIKLETTSKEINNQIRQYFDQANREAQTLTQAELDKASRETEELVKSNRLKIKDQMDKARVELKKVIPELSKEIETKFLN